MKLMTLMKKRISMLKRSMGSIRMWIIMQNNQKIVRGEKIVITGGGTTGKSGNTNLIKIETI